MIAWILIVNISEQVRDIAWEEYLAGCSHLALKKINRAWI